MQIYTFVTRGLLHICFCRHTHTHTIKFAIAIIMHINKSTAEEDVSVYKNKHRSTRKHYITNIAKTNSSVNLSVSLPLSDPQINHHILILHKEHFSSSVFFFFFSFSKLLGSGLVTRPSTTPSNPPREQPCLGLSVSQEKSAPCSVCSAHIITQHSHSPRTSTSKKRLQI